MSALSLHSIHKTFGAVRVLEDITFDIADGEFVVLVGPSGCGKSTLLRMIAGLEDVTAGEIHIGDRVVNDVRPRDRDVAMVFQNYALYPHMTVARNMGFSLKLRGERADVIDRKVTETAAILGLTDYLSRYPRELSGGQRQRVAMGRSIVRDPSVFLFDEPLSNLDAKLRVQMRGEIRTLHQRLRTTTVYVTHDQVEAMTMADRIVVLRDGRVEQIGAPLELYDRPANVFVAGFIGSPSMNFLDTLPGYGELPGNPRQRVDPTVSGEAARGLDAALPGDAALGLDAPAPGDLTVSLDAPSGNATPTSDAPLPGGATSPLDPTLPADATAVAGGRASQAVRTMDTPSGEGPRLDGGGAVYGVRPEHVELCQDGAPAEVILVEPTGSETQITLRLAGQEALAVVRERLSLRPGDQVRVRIDPDRVHVFDRATGTRLP